MSKQSRADALRLPAGLDETAAAQWRAVAPIVWKRGMLDEIARQDIEWYARLWSRYVELKVRATTTDDDADQLEATKVLKLYLRLHYRYGLGGVGRVVMDNRGWPGTLNPLTEDMLDVDEGGVRC